MSGAWGLVLGEYLVQNIPSESKWLNNKMFYTCKEEYQNILKLTKVDWNHNTKIKNPLLFFNMSQYMSISTNSKIENIHSGVKKQRFIHCFEYE